MPRLALVAGGECRRLAPSSARSSLAPRGGFALPQPCPANDLSITCPRPCRDFGDRDRRESERVVVSTRVERQRGLAGRDVLKGLSSNRRIERRIRNRSAMPADIAAGGLLT